MWRKFVALPLAIILLCLSGPLTAVAGEYAGSNIVTNNIHDHEYGQNSYVSDSYIANNGDGTFSRVENMGDIILVEKYNASCRLLSQMTVPFELSMFGGFYSGANYNYLVFGQPNPSQSTALECVRIVKYSKNWVRLGYVSVTNCNTTIPFYGCGTDICEYGNYLYVRMGHQTYADASGIARQATMTISCRMDTFQVVDVQSGLSGMTYGCIENTGATYIDVADGVLAVADHSLVSPYGIVVSRYGNNASNGRFQSSCANASFLGSVGSATGYLSSFSLGGFESSAQYYLVAGNTNPQDGTSSNQNVFVAAIPKNGFSSANVSFSYLTGYAYGVMESTVTPYLVKINSNMFLVLWETREGYSDTGVVHYAFVDGRGQRTSDVKSMNGCLSDCQPAVVGNKVVWYTTNGANMRLYTIPLSDNTSAQQVYVTGQNRIGGVDYSAVFDFNYYINRYPDIRVLMGNNPEAALQHFITSGMAEGRQGCENFNVAVYRENYSDLQAAFGNNLQLYYLHFMTSGNSEGRNARTRINP